MDSGSIDVPGFISDFPIPTAVKTFKFTCRVDIVMIHEKDFSIPYAGLLTHLWISTSQINPNYWKI